ncbi:hypothetical protein M427DRAFT_72892 [Gonapodya prolifera JEL478]|uniref:C2 DOCK-type domain-containing protein n=1 Tax=Gonapodya prolifera (strain JEL478) TaxID=1344416 RepID=A0A139A4U0_GONPJ|nr:hypothetical protein M427DRAFT_72892 [Gonapodya prolifera JEL478]|eukprot:KXS11403.1 hypothetical protein M427DRAFT_72892 [Gonapodya prolifera JEL478]
MPAPSWRPLPRNTYGVAIHSFIPVAPAAAEGSDANANNAVSKAQVSLEVGDNLHLLEENPAGWVRGYVFSASNPSPDTPKLGIFPANHVFSRTLAERSLKSPLAVDDEDQDQSGGTAKDFVPPAGSTNATSTEAQTVRRKVGLAHQIPKSVQPPHDTVSGSVDPLIDDISRALRSWSAHLRTLLKSQKYQEFSQLRALFNSLFQHRRQLVARTLSLEELSKIRRAVVGQLHEGAALLGTDLIVRDSEGRILTEADEGVVGMFRRHVDLADKAAAGTLSTSWVSDEPDSSSSQRARPRRDSPAYIRARIEELEGKVWHLWVESMGGQKDDEQAIWIRRPVGAAVMKLSDIVGSKSKESNRGECYMEIVMPSQETAWHNLPETIITGNGGGYDVSSQSRMVCLALRALEGDLKTVIRQTGGSATSGAVFTSRCGYGDVLPAGDNRNSIYVTLVGADLSQNKKGSYKTFEVALQIRLNGGEVIEDCVVRSSGDSKRSIFESISFYHVAAPKWNETIRVDLAPEVFEHIFLAIRGLSAKEKGAKSERAFAFGWLPLMNSRSGTVVGDGVRTLSLFKWDVKAIQSAAYLQEAWSGKIDVGVILREVSLVGEMEVLKFLTDILDALLAVLESVSTASAQDDSGSKDWVVAPRRSKTAGDSVLEALVYVLGIVLDKRFVNHRPEAPAVIQKSKELRNAIKVMNYILRLGLRSGERALSRGNGNEEEVGRSLKASVLKVFDAVERMMGLVIPDPVLGAQTLALQYSPRWIPELNRLFSLDEVAAIVVKFSDSTKNNRPAIMGHRLGFARELLLTDLVREPRGRLFMTASVVRWVSECIDGEWERTL